MDATDYGLPPSFNRRIHSPRIRQQQLQKQQQQQQYNSAAQFPTYPSPVHQDGMQFGPNQQPPQPYDHNQQGGLYPTHQQGYPQQGYPLPQQQQGMSYQQQQPGGPPPQGYFANNDRGYGGQRRGAEEGFCAALTATFAACCCLELCLF